MGPIKNTPALVQITAWWWPGDKPQSKPMISKPIFYWRIYASPGLDELTKNDLRRANKLNPHLIFIWIYPRSVSMISSFMQSIWMSSYYYILVWPRQILHLHQLYKTIKKMNSWVTQKTLQWRHNERDGVSNHRRLDCLLNRLFRHRWKKTSTPRVAGLCERNSPVTGEFPTQRASNAKNVSIWWRHQGKLYALFSAFHRNRLTNNQQFDTNITLHQLYKTMKIINELVKDNVLT